MDCWCSDVIISIYTATRTFRFPRRMEAFSGLTLFTCLFVLGCQINSVRDGRVSLWDHHKEMMVTDTCFLHTESVGAILTGVNMLTVC